MAESAYKIDPDYELRAQDDSHTAGCKKLWARVLMVAFEDYQQFRLGNDIKHIEDFVESNHNEDLGFNWICTNLGLNPDYVRKMFKETELVGVKKLKFDYIYNNYKTERKKCFDHKENSLQLNLFDYDRKIKKAVRYSRVS